MVAIIPLRERTSRAPERRVGENKSTIIVRSATAREGLPCSPSSARMIPAVMAAVRKTTLVINDTRGQEHVAADVAAS
eukprot:5545232-Pleurochrysis_carterae.AAC.2